MINMNETRLCTIEQIEEFLSASAEVDFSAHAERVNDFATPCVMNLRCSVVLGQLASLIPVVG